jgi:hypothetical protein
MMIDELTDSVGCYVWLQRNLAEALEAWCVVESDPEVVVYLHGLARRCRAHSAGWEDLLADSPALEASGRVQAPSPGWEGLFRTDAGGTQEHLVTLLHVVLPRLLASVERFGGRLGEVAEAAEKRFCGVVVEDLRAQLANGVPVLDQRAGATSRRKMAAALSRRLADLSC